MQCLLDVLSIRLYSNWLLGPSIVELFIRIFRMKSPVVMNHSDLSLRYSHSSTMALQILFKPHSHQSLPIMLANEPSKQAKMLLADRKCCRRPSALLPICRRGQRMLLRDNSGMHIDRILYGRKHLSLSWLLYRSPMELSLFVLENVTAVSAAGDTKREILLTKPK